MSNLTSEQQIVKPVAGVDPLPNHDLVLFKRVGATGHVFHSVLAPDQKVGIGITLRSGSLVAYAVTRDRNLRHRFSIAELRSKENLGPFSLSLMLALTVANSRLLVETLESDPLRRLEEEVGDIFKVLLPRMGWFDIVQDPADFERRLLDMPMFAEGGKPLSSRDYLKGFAAQLGFRLDRVHVSLSLPPGANEDIRVALEEEIKRRINEEKQKTALQEMDFQRRVEELGAWRERVVRSLGKVLDQIADKVDTAPALRSVLNELAAMQRDITALSSRGAPDSVAVEIKAVEGKGLLTAASETPLAAQVSRVFAVFSSYAGEPRDLNRLLSLMLHLLAELALLEEVDDELVQGYASRLEEEHRRLARQVTEEQRCLLFDLQNLDALRADLARD